MKKLFTMLTVCALTLSAFAGSTIQRSTQIGSPKIISNLPYSQTSSLRSSVTCDTLSNLSVADSLVYLIQDTVGYLTGNGALFGGSFLPNLNVAEKFDAPNSTGNYVSGASIYFGYTAINAGDSGKKVTVYVYDTTGVNGGDPYAPSYTPGNAIDSASTTLGAIAADVTNTYTNGLTPTNFTFNNVSFNGRGFFIVVGLPNTTGDTIAVFTNSGQSGNGHGWVEISFSGSPAWILFDSIGGAIGNVIFPSVCNAPSTCPTITVTATEIGNTKTADATATGGTAPYTFHWSTSQIADTATGLKNDSTYTVTATDHNGCTGTATVSISTGIASIDAGVTNFSVFPNPSNGVFTANVSLVAASDVTISVTDMTGSKIFESTDKAVKDLSKQINLSTIATGIYFVSVKTAQGTANQRIVIK